MNALLLSATLLLPQDPTPHVEIADPAFDGLGTRWEAAMGELGVPGMAMVVVEGDRVLHLATFGTRDVESGEPVTPDTIFYIASATKPFVALAVMQLVEDEKVELDAPVRRYLPRFRLADEEAARTVTVRDLLCHAPGINSFPIVFLDAYTGEITEDRYYHFLQEVEPLGHVSYSNVHFTLAGRIVAAVTGEPWKDVLRERVFAPAGMDRTTGHADWMYAQADVAIPTVWSGDGPAPAPVRKTDATMHAAGGLGTSIHDAARWLLVQLNHGVVGGERLLSEEGMEEMLAPQSSFPRPQGWLRRMEGFGLGWNRGTYRGRRYFQHGGGYVGSASLFAFLPDEGLGVAVLANTDAAGQAICTLVSVDVLDFLLGDESGTDLLPDMLADLAASRAHAVDADGPSDPPPAEVELTLDARAYVGVYHESYWGDFHVEIEDGELRGRMGNVRFALSARGTDRFLADGEGLGQAAEGSFAIEGEDVVGVTLALEDREVVFRR